MPSYLPKTNVAGELLDGYRKWKAEYTGEKRVDTPFGPAKQEPNLLRSVIPAVVEGVMGGEPGSVDSARSLLFGIATPVAYHGSPHAFDKFDTSKIGTGQGAASYGHGLYFAENPAVAKQYQEELSRGASVPMAALEEYFKPGRVVNGYSGKDVVVGFKRNPAQGHEWAVGVQRVGTDERVRWHATMPSMKEVEPVLAAEGKAGLLAPAKGSHYKADIFPPADKFLDWDKPFSQQTQEVQQALLPIIKQTSESFPDVYGKDLTGGQLYKLYVSHRGGDQRAASEALRDAGIAGNRYLDQGSRDASKGTYNYVVFNDKDVKILERK